MMFAEFNQKIQDNFTMITEGAPKLFEVDADKDKLWELYIESFPEGTNEIYRERRQYDCSCCRHFIKTFGNVVVIKDNKILTMWDLNVHDTTFQPVVDALAKYVKSRPVTDIFVSYQSKIGTESNRELLPDKRINTYHHFYIELPHKFVSDKRQSIGEVKGEFRDVRNVFKRSLDEITEESVMTILELIDQNSLYRGEEWKSSLTTFLDFKREYDKLKSDEEKENFAWENTIAVNITIGKIRNHSIGTLLVDVSEDMDLDLAVKKYEKIVAPTNYKRPKAIYSKKMLEDAKKQLEELGYLPSLQRRFATLDDISVNNILFSNRDAQSRITDTDDIFASMEKEIAISPKKFSKVEEVAIEDFVKNVLPTAKEVEILFENRLAPNMVSLIAPQNPDALTMFKWNNGYSWAYSGNITDSDIRENVKSAGGKVNGVLRFSIQWNDTNEWDSNDLDAHCTEPNGNEIYYAGPKSWNTLGKLDVDITHPLRDTPAVENITWPSKSSMDVGKYVFSVHQYRYRGGKNGFRAEIEFDGNIYQFEYRNTLRQSEIVPVAEVMFDGENFSINELLPSNLSSREIWGINSNQFVPVSVIMYSPNYWDEQDGIGNRHYFFMLKDCINSERPNAFYNEFLKNELMQHKRVFEALGSKAHVEDATDQLSGIGFSSTKRNELIVKVKGSSERVIKVKF